MKTRNILIIMAAAMTLTFAGCGKKAVENIIPEATPTPEVVATATPTMAPTVTPTPLPTSTPAPRVLGTKTSTASFVYLTNNTNASIREFYLKKSGYEEWGDNLIPAESSIKSAEQVQLFYEKNASSSEEENEEESSASAFDLRVVDHEGNSYDINNVNLADMEKATLRLNTTDQTMYISYMSISEKKEKSTNSEAASTTDKNNEDSQSEDDSDYSDYSDYSDDSDYDSDDSDYEYYDYDEDDSDYDDYDYNEDDYEDNDEDYIDWA